MRDTVARRRWFGIGVMIAPMLLALCTAVTVAAATRQVVPGGTNSGDCIASPCGSIAFAVGVANDNDTVTVAAGTYTEPTIAISKSITITGAGANTTTESGGRVTVAAGNTVTISGLTITNSHPARGVSGGGIDNLGTLTLNNVVITGNSVDGDYQQTPPVNVPAFGAGIFNESGGVLTLNNSTVSNNVAGATQDIGNGGVFGGAGGGIATKGNLFINNGTISGNIARGGETHYGGIGAGIFIRSPAQTVTITGATISGNDGEDWGLAISTGYDSVPGTLTLDHVMVQNHNGPYATKQKFNYAVKVIMALVMRSTTITNTAGGGIWASGTTYTVSDSTISNNTGYWEDDAAGGNFTSVNSGNSITRTTISGNIDPSNASVGGLYATNATITDSLITGNQGYVGGVTATRSTIQGTTISNNLAHHYSGDPATPARAGGLSVADSTISNSTISGNSSEGGTAGVDIGGTVTVTGTTVSGNTGGAATSGDGVYVDSSATGLTITNSTISGNGGNGVNAQGSVTLINSTVADNSVGVYSSSTGNAAVKSSILANTGANCSISLSNPGKLSLGGYNVISDTSCPNPGATDLTNTDPKIAALALNAPGTTQTRALLAGSPAIDRIPNTGGCNGAGLTTDQRGVARPQPAGGLCDSGAYEAAPSAPPTPTGLKVTGATYNSLTWGWTNPDPTASLIYTVDGSHFYGLAAGTTTFTLYGIPYGGYGCMSIAAYNSVGSSGYTTYSCSHVQPITPYNPHQTAGTTSTGTIIWTNYDTLSYEQVYDYAGAAWHQVGQNGTSYTLTGIPAGYYHCAAVQAYNVDYTSGYAYACPFATPNAPTNIHATSVSSTSVTFSWTASDPYSWYYVYETSPAAGHVVTGTSFTTTHIIVSGQHGYACIYVGAGGYGGTSATFPYACAWAY